MWTFYKKKTWKWRLNRPIVNGNFLNSFLQLKSIVQGYKVDRSRGTELQLANLLYGLKFSRFFSFYLKCCISITMRICKIVWRTFLVTKCCSFRKSKPFSNQSNFKFFFIIRWFDLICCISVTMRILEMVWGTFLLVKWCRSRISKPFLNRSKFEIFGRGSLTNLLLT